MGDVLQPISDADILDLAYFAARRQERAPDLRIIVSTVQPARRLRASERKPAAR